MRKLDLYWMSNREWITFTEEGPVLRDDAPPEAKESYERYLKQIGEGEYGREDLV